jgi:hypothetical protein
MKLPIANRQLAIGNDLAVAEGFEPSHGRINNPVPYQLGYATKSFYRAVSGSERVEIQLRRWWGDVLSYEQLSL